MTGEFRAFPGTCDGCRGLSWAAFKVLHRSSSSLRALVRKLHGVFTRRLQAVRSLRAVDATVTGPAPPDRDHHQDTRRLPMNTNDTARHLARLALLAGLCTAAPLYAGTVAAATPTQSVTVKFGDLNLQSEAGVRALYSRIRTATRAVCSPEPTGDPLAMLEFKACRSKALSDAVARVGSPALAALHRSKVGGAPPVRMASSTDAR
jgi:UrcA family protein